MGRRADEGGDPPKSLSDGIEAYLIDQHNLEVDQGNREKYGRGDRGPKYARGIGCPIEFAFDILAERYGQDPITWPYRHDAVAVLRFLSRRAVEGKARALLARNQGKPMIEYEG